MTRALYCLPVSHPPEFRLASMCYSSLDLEVHFLPCDFVSYSVLLQPDLPAGSWPVGLEI